MLAAVLDDLRDQTALVSAAAWQRAPSPTWRTEAAEHDAIVRAAEAGDGDAASTLLRAHIESFLTRNFPSLADSTAAQQHRQHRQQRRRRYRCPLTRPRPAR